MSALEQAFTLDNAGQAVELVTLKMLCGNNHSQTSNFKHCTFTQLKAAAARPAQVAGDNLKAAKANAPICAPHDGTAKTKEAVLAHNSFTMLWADIDGGNREIEDVKRVLASLDVESFAIYATASSQPDDKRWRVLVETDQPIDFEMWHTLQSYLMEQLGGDNCATRPQQILYLPFKWEQAAHYEYATGEGEPVSIEFHPLVMAAIEQRERLELKAQQQAATAPKAEQRHIALADGQISPVETYNAAYSIGELLKQYGFRKVGRKYLHPNSQSGVPGVVSLDGRYYSHHSAETDPLADGHTHDAFDLFVEFEHGGDFDAAVKAAANQLDPDGQKQRQRDHMAAQVKPVEFDAVETEEPASQQEEQRNPGTVAAILAGTKLGKYAIQVADAIQMPRDTTVLTALGVASAPVSMVYNVAFPFGGHLPTSLYVATEQPASSGKSPVLNKLMKPIRKAIKEMNERAAKANENAGEDDPQVPFYRAFITDTTPEALDGLLIQHYGHFCLASAEQALVNTALGVSYGNDRKSNNDLMLKGYSGDWHSSSRVTRKGYEGEVFGAVTVIAQRGTIETILEQSNGTGIAERFIMLAEPTLLGYRDHLTPRQQPDMMLAADYEQAMSRLVGIYEKSRASGMVEYDDLPALHLSRTEWDKVNQCKQRLESLMADGGRYSHELLRGAAGKYDQRVMKVAAVLHTIESLMNGEEVVSTIRPHYVDMAIQLADLSLEQLYKAMDDKGLIGMSAEQEAIYEIVSQKDERGILWGDLYNRVKIRQPFKSYPGKGLASKVKEVVREMVDNGKLTCSETLQGGRAVNKFYAR